MPQDHGLNIVYPKSSNDRKFLMKYFNSAEKTGGIGPGIIATGDPANLDGILKSNRLSMKNKPEHI